MGSPCKRLHNGVWRRTVNRPVALTAVQARDEPLMIPLRRKIGLRDVAKEAGVSTATVSRAMNNPPAVSEALRARVASVVRHLGWVPAGPPRAPATQRTPTHRALLPPHAHGDLARATQAPPTPGGGGGWRWGRATAARETGAWRRAGSCSGGSSRRSGGRPP